MTLGGDGDGDGSSVKADIQEGVEPGWESRVTIAAQQILARHVRWPDHPTVPAPATYWPRLNIDLSDAILVNLDFSQCAFYALDLRRAVCKGPTQFLYASFERDALFEGATFFGNVSFRRASFLHRARFSGGKFHAGVSFRQTRFDSAPEFGDAATFGDHADRTWPDGRRVDRRLRPGRRPAARRHGGRLQARVSGDWVTVSAPGRQPPRVSECEEIRAVGFSPDGATFVTLSAASPGLAIYRRQDEAQ
jgi:hypothetical protein